MSIHISAKKEEIASIVLMPGDPLRAKYIAENNLENVKTGKLHTKHFLSYRYV